MANSIAAAGAVPPVETVQLTDISTSSSGAYDPQNAITDMLESAVKSAMRLPSSEITPSLSKNTAMPDGSDNPMIRDRSLDAPDAYNEQMEMLTEKFVTLYEEMTVFKVTWQIAKRAGRDIETLLKAQ